MADIAILPERFQAAFGIIPRRLFASTTLPKMEPVSEYTSPAILVDQAVIDTFSVREGRSPKGIKIRPYQTPLPPMLEVSRAKRIVQTAVNGRDGEVVELIGKENWRITIRGVLVGELGEYPEEQVAELHQLCEIDSVLEITSGFLNLFNIHTICLTDYSFGALQGFPDTQPYELTAISTISTEELIQELQNVTA